MVFEKNRFFDEKIALFEHLGCRQKFENPFFGAKNRFFSIFLKLSGNDYHRIWTDLEVLSHPPNDFKPTLTVFEKNRFFDEKMAVFQGFGQREFEKIDCLR